MQRHQLPGTAMPVTSLGWFMGTMGHRAPSPTAGRGDRDWGQQGSKAIIAEQATDLTVPR